jgi:hypothetical protein
MTTFKQEQSMTSDAVCGTARTALVATLLRTNIIKQRLDDCAATEGAALHSTLFPLTHSTQSMQLPADRQQDVTSCPSRAMVVTRQTLCTYGSNQT